MAEEEADVAEEAVAAAANVRGDRFQASSVCVISGRYEAKLRLDMHAELQALAPQVKFEADRPCPQSEWRLVIERVSSKKLLNYSEVASWIPFHINSLPTKLKKSKALVLKETGLTIFKRPEFSG